MIDLEKLQKASCVHHRNIEAIQQKAVKRINREKRNFKILADCLLHMKSMRSIAHENKISVTSVFQIIHGYTDND